MIYDCHMHMTEEVKKKHIIDKDEMLSYGIGGGQLISYPPKSHSLFYGEAFEAEKRLDMLFEAINRVPLFYPLYCHGNERRDRRLHGRRKNHL